MITAVITIIYCALILAWSLFYFVLMFILLGLTILFDPERVVLHKASRLWAKSIFWLNPLWRVRVYGKENVDPKGRYVVTVNHQSMLDIPLMYVLPRINFKWVAKKEIYRWPLFGQILWVHGDITVEEGSLRKARQFIVKGLERLRHGTSVIIFPEGTRSRDGEMRNFKEGAFILAKDGEVEILPCVINGVKGFIKGWRVQRCTFEVSIMKPLPVEQIQGQSVREVMSEVRAASVAELERLRLTNGK